MAGNGLRKVVGQRLYGFARRVARWVSDSRRQRFLQEMVVGLVIEPLKTYSGAPTSENDEILAHFLRIHEAAGRKGTWVLDRGFDRRELMLPMLRMEMAWIVRQRGDRHIVTAGGRQVSVDERAAELYQREHPSRWPCGGWTYTDTVTLPEAPHQEFLLVLSWRIPKKVIYWFDWLATQISRFLHPRPKISLIDTFDTG